MTPRLDARTTGLLALLLTVAAASALDRLAPPPVASTPRGSEQAFAEGLEAREIEDGVLARRWAGARMGLSFVNLPDGPLELELEVRSQRHPVLVSHGGAVLGTLPPGVSVGRYAIAGPRAGRVDLELSTETFIARGGRPLGFRFERAALRPSAAGILPPQRLTTGLLVLSAAALLAAWIVGLSPRAALALDVCSLGCTASFLLPYGLVRSPYASELCAWMAAGLVACAAAAWGLRAGRWGFGALLAAFLVQGVAPAHPCLVASDAVFHAHNLQAVANGDFGLTSLTPHDPPFRFPYGVSFYFVQVPLMHIGVDLTTLVRAFASLSALVAAASLYAWLAPRGPRRAALAVGLLQLLPVTFDLYSAGNYSNVFAQSVTLLFLAWWGGSAPGGVVVGALLLAVAGTAHFGGVLFLCGLLAVLAVATGGRLDRTRALALGVGGVMVAAYYVPFVGLMASQAARAASGGGGGDGLLPGLFGQLAQAVADWGWPVVLVALVGGLYRSRNGEALGPREMTLLGLSGLPFLAAAVLSPLEVRYLYAVAPFVALLAADGLEGFGSRPGPRTRLWRVLLAAALLAQAGLLVSAVARALFERYRG